MTGNVTVHLREAFEEYTPNVGRWTESKAVGDIVVKDGNAVAASYLDISKSPFDAGTETVVAMASPFAFPHEIAIGAHMSQRTLGQEFSLEIVDTDAPLEPVADLAIASISQATLTLTVTTVAPHNLRAGQAIGICGCADSRLNYPAAVVATTPTPLQFTVTAGPGGNLPSVTAGPFASGFVYLRSRLGYARNGASMIFENAVATNASFYVRSESGDVLPSGIIAGNHSVGINTTASTQAISAAATYAFVPTTEYRFVGQSDRVQWADATIDTTAQATARVTRTQVIPNPSKNYRLRFRASNNKSLTVPVGQIVSVAKTGSTTATIVTDVPHGLTTGDVFVAYGVRNQTDFANLATATAVASIVDATTFTAVWGASVTATSYGGYVARVNGGNLMSGLGAIAQSAQSVARAANVLTVTGNTTWAGLLIGDYVNLVGCRDASTGATLNLDGAYRVRNFATTSLELEPIDTTISPYGADFTSVNCGGAVIKRTCLRVSFVRVFDYERLRVEMLARPGGDAAGAAPVVVQNVPGVFLAGTVAEDTTAGTNAIVMGGVVRTARAPATFVAGDAVRTTVTSEAAATVAPGAPAFLTEVASAARTTTGNSGAISVATGGGIAGIINVTAVSGTSPTLDVTLEESFDNGTTWQLAWSAVRLVGVSTVHIPAMRVAGLRRWVWTIGGTTPSFTFAINVNHQTDSAPIIRHLYDRTAAVLNGTNGSATSAINIAGCASITAKVLLGAAAPAATYQIQLSDDAANWSNVGTATIGVANGTLTLAAPIGMVANFARVIVTSGGTGQSGLYVAIMAVG